MRQGLDAKGIVKLYQNPKYAPPARESYFVGAIGMLNELGELLGHYKKNAFQDQELDMEEVKKELADVLFYLALLQWEAEESDQSRLRSITSSTSNVSIENQIAMHAITDIMVLVAQYTLQRSSVKLDDIWKYFKYLIYDVGQITIPELEDVLYDKLSKRKEKGGNDFWSKKHE